MSTTAAKGPKTTVRTSGKMADPMPPEPATEAPAAFGVDVDGARVPLGGQPPIAHGGGWWPPGRNGNNIPQ